MGFRERWRDAFVLAHRQGGEASEARERQNYLRRRDTSTGLQKD